MIQSTYTSVSNAKITPCDKKGCIISSEPIPLLKNKYLGEYRTELEKAKVRRNLGIADETTLSWGNIKGQLENQEDLMELIASKWVYEFQEGVDSLEQIKTIQDAVNYSIKFIRQYEANTEDIERLTQALEQVNTDLEKLANSHEEDISNVVSFVEDINRQIIEINESIVNIDVDKNILNWIENNLSDTIRYNEGLEVVISTDPGNAISNVNGLYVKDLQPSLDALSTSLSNTYTTNLSEDTTSSMVEGTTVKDLEGKTFSEIIDTLIFPAAVRPLVSPTISYTTLPELIKVGTAAITPVLTFVKNDAGIELSRKETISLNGSELTEPLTIYNSLGKYIYTGTVNYSEGEKLVNNRGEITNIYITAGSITATVQTETTYPIYYGSTGNVIEYTNLIPFNVSNEVSFSLSGKAEIWIPGNNSRITKFTADAGVGYTDVDQSGWSVSRVEKNGIIYQVLTKADTYPDSVPHKLNLILSL